MNATVLAGLLLLAPAQADLQVKNVQMTYGGFGPARPAGKVLPGDELYFNFDIEGLTIKDGKVVYSLHIEILSQGKVQFRQPPTEKEQTILLGGNSLQGAAQFEIGLATPPGLYDFKVILSDAATKKTQSFTKTIEILPKGFGLVQVKTTLDAAGVAPTHLFSVGQTAWVNFSAVGFDRAGPMMQPKLTFELTVLDETGKPTSAKPYTGTVDKDVPGMVAAIPGQFPLPLNRAGKFTVQVKAIDQLAPTRPPAVLTFPLQVLDR